MKYAMIVIAVMLIAVGLYGFDAAMKGIGRIAAAQAARYQTP